MERFESKLSKTRAGERTRIWLEGRRVAEAGFRVGLLVRRQWKPGALVLTIVDAEAWEALPRSDRGRVSGKGDKPILDITGAKIAEHFSGDRVAVRYSAGKITIGNPAD